MSEFNEIETVLLVYQQEFFRINAELFEPTVSDFNKWLDNLPDSLQNYYRREGFVNSRNVIDFLKYYYEQIVGVSIRDFIASKGLSKEYLDYWDNMQDARQILFDDINKGNFEK
jgi:uncharacterized protein YfdQ (DUF2303 family)